MSEAKHYAEAKNTWTNIHGDTVWVARVYPPPEAGRRPAVRITKNEKLFAVGELNGENLINVEPPLPGHVNLAEELRFALTPSTPVSRAYLDRLRRRIDDGDEDAQTAYDHAIELHRLRIIAGNRDTDLRASTFAGLLSWLSAGACAFMTVRSAAYKVGLKVAKIDEWDAAKIIAKHLEQGHVAPEGSE